MTNHSPSPNENFNMKHERGDRGGDRNRRRAAQARRGKPSPTNQRQWHEPPGPMTEHSLCYSPMHQNMPPRMFPNTPQHNQQNMQPCMQHNMPQHNQQNMQPCMPPQNYMPPPNHMPPQNHMPSRMPPNTSPHHIPPYHMQRHPFPVRPLSAAPPLIKHAGHPNSRKEQKKNFVSSDHSKRKTVPKSKITPNSVDNRNRKHKQKQMHSREDAGNKGLKSADYKSTLEPDIDAEMTEKLSKKIVMENNHNVLPASPIVESKSGSEIVKSDNTDEQEKIESASEEDQGLSEQDPLRINECSRASRELMQSELCHALKVKEDQSRPSIPMQKVMTLKTQREPILTTDSVPMNFGIELLDSVIHNNIELIADQGAVIRANSVILSLNSPVIHRITTSLELKEIDMREFSEKSVRVFVEAAYTGRLPDIPSDVFRDLHKISCAFQVKWLCRSCFAMFSEFSSQIDELLPPYLEQVFLFEEAAYILSKLKLVHFQDLAIAKIQSYEFGKKMFISKYLKGLSSLSACHIDMIVLLAGSDIDLIVEPLKELLLKQLEMKETEISDECKYLLNRCDLSPCRRYNSNLFEQLFDVLQELAGNSSEDMKWIFQLHRNSANKLEEIAKEKNDTKEENHANHGNVVPTERKRRWFWQK